MISALELQNNRNYLHKSETKVLSCKLFLIITYLTIYLPKPLYTTIINRRMQFYTGMFVNIIIYTKQENS